MKKIPRRHKLLPKAIREKLPRIYCNERRGLEQVALVKFFTPDSNWTWYATEFDGEDQFFGLVDGFEMELGYFSLGELEETKGPWGLPIERDLYWEPKTLMEIMKIEDRREEAVKLLQDHLETGLPDELLKVVCMGANVYEITVLAPAPVADVENGPSPDDIPDEDDGPAVYTVNLDTRKVA